MDLSPQDRDMMIRTVIGEAADQPVDGQLAVAHVILNRTNSGQYGDSPTKVVLARHQFEPWQTRARELMNIDPNSDEYQRTAAVVDAAASGQAADPTGGATYFLEPNVVRARRGGSLPDWASGPQMKIGGHIFYYDKGTQPKFAQAAPQDGDVSPDDIASTMQALGIGGSPAAPGSSPKPGIAAPTPGATGTPSAGQDAVSDGDVADTAKALGIDLQPSGKPMPADVPAAPGKPMRVTIPVNPYKETAPNNAFVEGMPLIGPGFDRAMAASAATLGPLANLIRGGIGKQPLPIPAEWGDRYAQNYKQITDANQDYAKEHPVASAVKGLAGAGMVMGPLAETAVGGRLLGTVGESLPIRSLTGGIGNAVIGGTDAYLRGNDPVTGAEIGTAAGMAGPLLGQAASGVGRYIANKAQPLTSALRNYMPATISRLIQAIEGETPQSLQQNAERMGPHGFLGDLNGGLTDLAGGAADISGPNKQVVRQAYKERADGQRPRIEKALNDAYGVGPVDVNSFTKWLTETRAAAADPLYKQWRSMQVHPTDEIKALIPRLEAAEAFAKAEESAGVRGEPLNKKFFTSGDQKEFPTTESWDLVKRGLDRRIDAAYVAGDKKHAADLINLKKDMIREIEKTPAGKIWNQARQEFAERSSIIDQLARGKDDFLGGRSGTTADELREELSTLKGPERAARIVGQRKAIAEGMDATIRGDGTMRAKLLAPSNQEKLRMTLGKARADKLIKTLEQEQFLMEQQSNVVGNIQTGASGSMRSERKNALLPNPAQPWGLDLTKPGTYLPPSWREAIQPHGMMNAYRGARSREQLNELAPLLTMMQSHSGFADLVQAIQAEGHRRATSPLTLLGHAVQSRLTGATVAPQIQQLISSGSPARQSP